MDKKLNRQRWLTAGLQTLSEEGPNGLKIMPLAERLGVTKGSFYWHFQSLDEYHHAVLAEWEQHYTQEAIRWLESDDSKPEKKLRIWITGASYADLRLDSAIRSWSLANPAVLEVRKRVDEQRISYLTKLLREVGWPPNEAATLGRWTYWAWVGYATLGGPIMNEKQLGLILAVLEPRR
ncbi:TetR/AcrR family transcriptional regulator [Noviherbaspirillum denitrificans]|uniref:HTH tetR-type domain-containing protein n=1 Tax=Noviherbaspirillum denitrificans TaxID=1968433 RepID=A0A254TG26_9BURK|nr:TetR/AcrR family transcriptional regulator [Noviherbaspirillum denitrificans]OWW19483.1 hypothetical protein AYR66_08125 [Noviherbaspirillum denitrificans]